MKAVICTRYGPPEVLELKDVETPVPKAGEVRVRIRCAPVNTMDTRIRGFKVPLSFWIPAKLMLGIRRPKDAVLGNIVSGEVDALGDGAKRFGIGDRVFGFTVGGFGAYAEYKCQPEERGLARIPPGVSFEEAAAVPFGGTTALHFLRAGKVVAGQRVLVYGASGSVGTAAVQLAKVFGAKVTGVCGTANVDMIRAIGADEVIDYTKEDFTKRGERWDVVFDAVGKTPFSASVRSLDEGGVYLHVVAIGPAKMRMRLTPGSGGKRFVGGSFKTKVEDLEYLMKLVVEGKFKPVIDKVYPLEGMVEAHRYVDAGHKKGNVIIKVQ